MIKFRKQLKDMLDVEVRNWRVVDRAGWYSPPCGSSHGQATWTIECIVCGARRDVPGQEVRRDRVSACRHTNAEPISEAGKARILELITEIDQHLDEVIKVLAA